MTKYDGQHFRFISLITYVRYLHIIKKITKFGNGLLRCDDEALPVSYDERTTFLKELSYLQYDNVTFLTAKQETCRFKTCKHAVSHYFL